MAWSGSLQTGRSRPLVSLLGERSLRVSEARLHFSLLNFTVKHLSSESFCIFNSCRNGLGRNKLMPRLRPLVKKEWIEERIQRGRGSGTGADYEPWLVIQDFSSLGRVHRIKGWKHGRVHHLFSDLERKAFFHHQWPKSVSDIREQFPLLPVEETVEIAKEMGVRHPSDPRTKHPIVMTTDLFLTVEQGLRATYCPITVKYFRDLQNLRTTEKLEIERRYWAAPPRNFILKIFTERQVNEEFVKNMLWVHPFFWLSDLYPLSEHEVNNISLVLTRLILNEALPLRVVAHRCDRLLRLEAGTSLVITRHLLANRYWDVNMSIRIRTDQPLILLNSPDLAVFSERKLWA
jgi:hypothetical protein